MKMSKFGLSLLGAALMLTTGAFAGEANKATLHLAEKVTIDGKSLNPGDYKIQWDGSGSTVQVSVLKGKETVATFPAHLTEQPSRNLQDAYSTTASQDGTLTLSAIYVGGKKTTLQVDQNQATQQSNANSGN